MHGCPALPLHPVGAQLRTLGCRLIRLPMRSPLRPYRGASPVASPSPGVVLSVLRPGLAMLRHSVVQFSTIVAYYAFHVVFIPIRFLFHDAYIAKIPRLSYLGILLIGVFYE